MNIGLGKGYLILSFLLGVFTTILITYFLFNEVLSPTTTAKPTEPEGKPVYLDSNDIVVQKTGKSLMIDGSKRTLPAELPLFYFHEEIYAPLEIMCEYLGVSYTQAANGIVIGNYPSLEPFAFTDSMIPFTYIGSTFTREQMEERLGKAIEEKQLVNPSTGVLETVIEYPGATVHYSTEGAAPKVLQITVKNPLLLTHRGITVGSTKDEVLHKYGPPGPESTDETWIYGEKYALWFQFEENRVVEYGNMYVKSEENDSNNTDNDKEEQQKDNDKEKEED